jgi:hypothetical protein
MFLSTYNMAACFVFTLPNTNFLHIIVWPPASSPSQCDRLLRPITVWPPASSPSQCDRLLPPHHSVAACFVPITARPPASSLTVWPHVSRRMTCFFHRWQWLTFARRSIFARKPRLKPHIIFQTSPLPPLLITFILPLATGECAGRGGEHGSKLRFRPCNSSTRPPVMMLMLFPAVLPPLHRATLTLTFNPTLTLTLTSNPNLYPNPNP